MLHIKYKLDLAVAPFEVHTNTHIHTQTHSCTHACMHASTRNTKQQTQTHVYNHTLAFVVEVDAYVTESMLPVHVVLTRQGSIMVKRALFLLMWFSKYVWVCVPRKTSGELGGNLCMEYMIDNS